MKRIILLVAVLIISMTIKAQNIAKQKDDVKTVFGNGGSFGGFLETGIKVGDINGQSGLLVGGALSAVFSSRMNIGMAGYGLATKINADTYDDDNRVHELDMGYGGILLEPVIGHKKMVHITLPILLGVGGAGLRYQSNYKKYEKTKDGDIEIDGVSHFHYDSDVFLVAEPGLSIEVNLLRNIRLDFGATYRYIYDSTLEGISDEELGGFTGSVGLKFGWF